MERSRLATPELVSDVSISINRNFQLKWQSQNTSTSISWTLSLRLPWFGFLPRLHLLSFVHNTITSINRHVCYLSIMQHKNPYSDLTTITFERIWHAYNTLDYVNCLHIEGNLWIGNAFYSMLLRKQNTRQQ